MLLFSSLPPSRTLYLLRHSSFSTWIISLNIAAFLGPLRSNPTSVRARCPVMTTLMLVTPSNPGLCLLTEKSRKMLRMNSRQSQVLAQDRPRGTIFCQRERNLLLSFYNPLYSNPRKAEKQLLIKQSMKLYVVIKCHQSTEHHMQIKRVEGLSSFHMLWSFLLFFSQ